jgi:hypothetical protein
VEDATPWIGWARRLALAGEQATTAREVEACFVDLRDGRRGSFEKRVTQDDLSVGDPVQLFLTRVALSDWCDQVERDLSARRHEQIGESHVRS